MAVAKYSLGLGLRSATIPSKKIKQFISNVAFLLCSFFLLKLFHLFRGPNAPKDEHECESGSFKEKINRPVESSFDEFEEEEAKRSEMEWRSTSSSFNRGSHTVSMRAEKEWIPTLAFQERTCSVVGGGGEGMDKLWEVYETTEEDRQRESHRGQEEEKSERKSKNNKSRIVDYLEEFEEEEEGDVASVCCLKALKLSVGKMNFGMKISKAFKGIRPVGWLNHRHHKKKMKMKNKGL